MAKRSLGWEWFTAHEIKNLKEISRKELEEVRNIFRKYDHMYPSIQTYKIIAILAIIWIIITGYLKWDFYWYIITWTILVVSYWQIKWKLWEENWYLEWYQDWVDKWVNKALWLTEEDENFISEVNSWI